MQRVLVVYNSRSSRFKDVNAEILEVLNNPTRMQQMNLVSTMVGKYEVKRTSIEDNVKQLAKIIRDDDLLLSVGGDATAVIAANAIMASDKDARLAVLPYGNFNDLARTLRTKKLKDVFNGKEQKLYPLEILVDGKRWRYATCYTTIGMTAASVEIFDNAKVRKKLQKGSKHSWRSYLQLASWYFKNRHKKVFLPEFKLNGVLQSKKITDYAAVNGRSMARVMKGGTWFTDKKVFRREVGKLANFWNLFVLMAKSILVRVPGKEITKDEIEFVNPATVEIQAEGEYKVLENISKIEIRKAEKCLKVITN